MPDSLAAELLLTRNRTRSETHFLGAALHVTETGAVTQTKLESPPSAHVFALSAVTTDTTANETKIHPLSIRCFWNSSRRTSICPLVGVSVFPLAPASSSGVCHDGRTGTFSSSPEKTGGARCVHRSSIYEKTADLLSTDCGKKRRRFCGQV